MIAEAFGNLSKVCNNIIAISEIILINVVVTYKIRSFDVRSFNNWPTIKLKKIMRTNILSTNILPNNVVKTTDITAAKPNDSFDLCHKMIPGIVANNASTSPSGGNICKAKATTMKAIMLRIVALGYILKTSSPLLYYF